MPDHTEHLKSMLQDIINDRSEQARVTMHDYFIAKTREVAGLDTEDDTQVDTVTAENPDGDPEDPDADPDAE